MTAHTATLSWISDRAARLPAVGVLLLEHDPISRHFLCALISQAGQLRLVAGLDSRQPADQLPLRDVDVVLLAVGPDEDPRLRMAPLIARGARVLVLGSHWNRERLEAVFAVGARGCLVKAPDLANLAEALRAVAAGHTVLPPELLRMLLPGREPRRMPSATRPAADPTAADLTAADLTAADLTAPDQTALTAAPAAGRQSGLGRATTPSRLAVLTGREREVLLLLAAGRSTKEAAAQLHVSPSTVKSHISHALTKLDARNRLEAVLLLRDEAAADTC